MSYKFVFIFLNKTNMALKNVIFLLDLQNTYLLSIL